MDSNLNQLAPITDFENAYILAQQAHELGFRGSTFPELYTWLKGKLDLTGLSNTAGLPEDFPTPGSTLAASNPQEWTILIPGTYNKVVSGTVTISEDEFGFAQFDGTDFNRVLRVRVPNDPDNLKISQIDISGGVTSYRSFKNLESKVQGGEIIFGESDLSSYTTNNTQEFLFLHRAFPVNVKGEFVEANIVFHRGGAYNVYIARPVIGQPQKFTMLGKSAKTAVIGVNTITSNIEVLPGDLIAIGQIAGGALIKTKAGTNNLWLNTTTENADVANGTEISFSGSNRIMALNFKIKVESIQNKVETVESEVISSMKEEKLKYKPSINRFDPSKLVNDRYVNSSGGITSPSDPTPGDDADDWKMLYIDISDIPAGTKINWGAINVTKPGYIAFYNKPQYIPGDSIQLVEGTIDAPALVNFTNSSGSTLIPSNAKGFAINAKRASDTDSVFERAMINIGPELLPYEPFSVGTIIEYNGIPFENSNPNGEFKTDQNTRTTDNVAFFKLTVEELETNVIVANIPEWDELSSNNILKDQAYKVSDGNGNFIIKAKGGV